MPEDESEGRGSSIARRAGGPAGPRSLVGLAGIDATRLEPATCRPEVIAALRGLIRGRADELELAEMYARLLATALDPRGPAVELLDVITLAQVSREQARLLAALTPHERSTAGILVREQPSHLTLVRAVAPNVPSRGRCAALFAVPRHARLAHPARTSEYLAELTRLGIIRVRRSSWDGPDALLRSDELDAWLLALRKPIGHISFEALSLEATTYGAHLLRACLPAANATTRRDDVGRDRARLSIVEL